VNRFESPLVSLQSLVQDFFEKYLPVERHASHNTVLAYRDALKLFLLHVAEQKECSPDQLDFAAFDVNEIRSFLVWLEKQRRNGARTRNQRLAAIKAFARFVGTVAPEHLERCRRIRELQPAHFEQPEVQYLDDEEILKLFRAIDPATNLRDRALLLLLYNTGARVQEIVDLDASDVRLDAPAIVTLRGKGRKQRTCPLWARTAEALQAWIADRGLGDGPLFLNAQGYRLSRSGVAYILQKLTAQAGLSPRRASHISPHVIRHTTAMHLLDAGVDITTIAAWMGHAQLSTTHGYIEVSLRMKQKAIAAAVLALPALSQGEFPRGNLLNWLASLSRTRRYVQPPPLKTAPAFPRARQLYISGHSP
jgi:integrase/recombinase XerD